MNEITKTIYQTLYATGRIKVWSWGIHAFRSLEDGLQFKVQGHHFKGHVRIIYNYGLDLYEVSFGRLYKNQWHEKKKIDEVYFDQLVDVIDEFVEYIPQYKF